MNILRAALVVPAALSGFWLHRSADESANSLSKAVAHVQVATQARLQPQSSSAKTVVVEEAVLHRRIRVERLLITLDHVAAVALQMRPEQVERLEPVIVDIAEQTLELIADDQIKQRATDGELDRLEEMMRKLLGSLEKMVEPEMSL